MMNSEITSHRDVVLGKYRWLLLLSLLTLASAAGCVEGSSEQQDDVFTTADTTPDADTGSPPDAVGASDTGSSPPASAPRCTSGSGTLGCDEGPVDDIEALPPGEALSPDERCEDGAPAYAGERSTLTVAVRVFIQEEGNRQPAVTNAQVEEDLDAANDLFAGSGIRFQLVGAHQFFSGDEPSRSRDEITLAYYYDDAAKLVDACGTAILGPTRRPIARVRADCLAGNTTAHELGHSLGLPHPHGTIGRLTDPDDIEPLEGDCYAMGRPLGDRLCDTAADPSTTFCASDFSCNVSCDAAQGLESYNPDAGLVMSYYNDACQSPATAFSPEQANTMRCHLATSYQRLLLDPERGRCDDGRDNDRDGRTDCDDGDCAADPTCGVNPLVCGDGVCTASHDEDCRSCPDDCGACPAEVCSNGADDDLDGDTDCDDADCAADPTCAPPPSCGDGLCTASNDEDCRRCPDDCGACPAEVCSNGADDDLDGDTDCDDSDCLGSPACTPPAEVCGNGVDDDGDGRADCEDPDCFSLRVSYPGADRYTPDYIPNSDCDCSDGPSCRSIYRCKIEMVGTNLAEMTCTKANDGGGPSADVLARVQVIDRDQSICSERDIYVTRRLADGRETFTWPAGQPEISVRFNVWPHLLRPEGESFDPLLYASDAADRDDKRFVILTQGGGDPQFLWASRETVRVHKICE